MTKFSATLASAALVIGQAQAKFYYDIQSEWPAVAATPEGTNQCAGEQQSPVNLNTGDYVCDSDAKPYSFYTGDCTLGDYEFTINDHGLKASVEKASCEKPKMIIPGTGKVYEVLQFHIHTGCENQFNATGCDADMHMVHIAKEDVALPKATSFAALPDLAVLGLMMYGVDEESEGMQPLIDSWMEVTCTSGNCVSVAEELKSQKFSPYDLVPGGTAVYNFQGSLTTPPCWEVVNWNLAEKPVLMSFKQILAISNLINHYTGYKGEDDTCTADETVASVAGLTSRDLQPMNGRQVVKNCESVSMMSSFPESAVELEEEAGTLKTQGTDGSSANMVTSLKAVSLIAAAVSAFALF